MKDDDIGKDFTYTRVFCLRATSEPLSKIFSALFIYVSCFILVVKLDLLRIQVSPFSPIFSEGQEDDTLNFDGDIQITPFNLKEEQQEGSFR
jgi:hypothetical protein